jgi:hypothetical protein
MRVTPAPTAPPTQRETMTVTIKVGFIAGISIWSLRH